MTTGLEFAGVGTGISYILMGFTLLLVVVYFFDTRKSQQYRKTLMDMYVAAKIKSLAKEDNLDIVEEFESFKKWKKKQNLGDKDLDNVIEEEIKERVTEPTKKKETKDKK